jgi:hypothetical protein
LKSIYQLGKLINDSTKTRHEHDLFMYLMDKKYINKQSCYIVVSFSGNKFFENKIELENYLISLGGFQSGES